jgi:deoxyinosine 3'endonuclease (endonuclease V)
MRFARTAAVLASLMLAVPAIGVAQTAAPAQAQPAPKAKKAATPSMSATRGVVKSISEDSLVITRGKSREMTFVLNSSTQRQGDIAAGMTVDVRYHLDGKSRVASAITAQPAKAKAPAKTPASKSSTSSKSKSGSN